MHGKHKMVAVYHHKENEREEFKKGRKKAKTISKKTNKKMPAFQTKIRTHNNVEKPSILFNIFV